MKINKETGLKICSHCKGEYPAEKFSVCLSTNDGLHPLCKVCSSEQNRKYREKNRIRNGGKVPDVKPRESKLVTKEQLDELDIFLMENEDRKC